ncbi:hypothetical protein DFH11DRAFT_1619488 [Phellopilus nigrolimitatus]|nr:hypothetical protein DFH11DRAFT_1619488 [Phellopilus nigrolimitatus]
MTTKEPVKALPARKSHAIKRADGEPLTREDLQYDLLRHIFDDPNPVFTDPNGDPPGTQVSFRDLYVNALVHSPKSSKAVRDKIAESPAFATDFAMISLLANVGRVNTTMAFFPETRTALRTYHPVPALQKTDGNLQDAPRIKNALKTCSLAHEVHGAPTTPVDILRQRELGQVPSTSVVNLIFVLNNHSGAVGRNHFTDESNGGGDALEFSDLFLPVPVPSAARAHAFLWLLFHYLEAQGAPNPYADLDALSTGRAPRLPRLLDADEDAENIDPPDEIAWGEKMAERRRAFLARDRERQEAVAATKEETGLGAGPSERGTETPPGKASSRSKAKGKLANLSDPPLRGRPTKLASKEALIPYPHLQPPRPTLLPAPAPESEASSAKSKPGGRGRKTKARAPPPPPPVQYEIVYAPPSPERTMLQHAWHTISTTDPLVDSDNEQGDEHVRLDYTRRLKTLNRLRGKSPTPEPLPPPALPPAAMDVDSGFSPLRFL